MVILPSLNAIYIHIPRTGGTALSVALNNAYEDAIMDLGVHHIHTRAKAIRKSRHYRNWMFFTVMRNSWDIVSSWRGFASHLFKDDEVRECTHPSVLAFHRPFIDMPYDDFVRHVGRNIRFVQFPGFYATYCDNDTVVCHSHSEVESLLGVSLQIPRANTSLDVDVTWTQEAIDRVAHLCTDDIQRFGYQPPSPGEGHRSALT